MELLRSILEEIRNGKVSFSPADESEAAFNAFQPIANRLKSCLDRGLVHNVKFLRSSSRTSRGFLTAMVVGGLTFEGEQFLAQSQASPQSVAPQQEAAAAAAAHMKIFLSHSHLDAAVAEALTDLLQAAFRLSVDEIRCTSVPGFKLPAGVESNEQLRREVFESSAFIALLSPASLSSTYVLFEMGARWGAKLYLAPILVSGATPRLLESPLAAINAISGSSEADMHQLVDDLGKQINLQPQKPHAYTKALGKFISAATRAHS